jgi:translation initiation factor IF-3
LINEKIKIKTKEVRLLDEKGKMLGVMETEKALDLANNKSLDLVLITEKANPPVAKIIDYGKFLYEKEKQKKELKKKQKLIQIKEMKLRPKIGTHDLDIKIKKITKFLEDKNKVKVTMFFMGREREHTDIGKNIMAKIIEKTQELADIEKHPNLMGNSMILVLVPKK